ncbi:TPA: hypothetical protein GDO54_018576 [Pyxicephalus adspersus]|uniref:Secreted protein n=1 Tax=Pyxicephalus adspersus TaxID=30357 RepID=A0AAV2ZP06_PYXAD|nr:TPA: hypothetical protein GDO54_018576 [Pyxicephalus adspersus]
MGRLGSAWHSQGSRALCLPIGIMIWKGASSGAIYQLLWQITRCGGRGGSLYEDRAGRFCNLLNWTRLVPHPHAEPFHR